MTIIPMMPATSWTQRLPTMAPQASLAASGPAAGVLAGRFLAADLVEPDPAALADGKKPEPIDRRWLRLREFVDQAVQKRGPARRNDRAGVILFGKRPRLVLPPAAVDRMPIDELAAGPIDGNYTDIAAALKLALASFPEGTAKRVVLISDGNENIGSAEEQAALAKQNDVQIDTLALAPGYRNENEVLVQAVEARHPQP
jgi:hypothetical protein